MSDHRLQPAGNRDRQPGSMTMAMRAAQSPISGPRVLRIVHVRDGKIVQERVMTGREDVLVGPSEDCHFIVPSEVLPKTLKLFEKKGSRYVLHFTRETTGRLSTADGVKKLSALHSLGKAESRGDAYRAPIDEEARGKVVFGSETFLFQFVVAPPPQPRPQLPAAARGGLVRSIDWRFTSFVVFTYLLFFGAIVYLENYDYPAPTGFEDVPDAFARLALIEPTPPEPEPEDEEGDEEGESEEKAEKEEQRTAKREEKSSGPVDTSDGEPTTTTADDRARIAEEVASKAEAMLLGAMGAMDGALSDVLAGGAITGGAEDVLAEARGVGVADSQVGSLRTRAGGGGSGQAGDLGSLRAAAGDANQARGGGGAIVERRVGRVGLESGGDIGGSGDFDPSIVASEMRKRMSAFKLCYENELRNDPDLRGKVVVKFTIETRGTVSNASTTTNTTNSSGLASCILSRLQRLRFNPGPTGGSVTFSYPLVFALQN